MEPELFGWLIELLNQFNQVAIEVPINPEVVHYI
ncbi:hypothetical protein NIES4071_109750 (plasmid) [Calothrix sp. NIES-4071]|nr:hypothetical protein NIES4071_109750 [Calothrix sp. NIES-4071]BAZ65260.1 hypothetical protein NIES4105_109930 [Calothrix sp. NIES-4105]